MITSDDLLPGDKITIGFLEDTVWTVVDGPTGKWTYVLDNEHTGEAAGALGSLTEKGFNVFRNGVLITEPLPRQINDWDEMRNGDVVEYVSGDSILRGRIVASVVGGGVFISFYGTPVMHMSLDRFRGFSGKFMLISRKPVKVSVTVNIDPERIDTLPNALLADAVRAAYYEQTQD